MALTYDQVSGLTHEIINESSSDVIFDSNPLLKHLLAKGKVVEGGGSKIRLPISYAKIAAVGNFTRYSLLDTNPTATESAAEWNWKYTYGQMIVSKIELAENEGKHAAVNLLKAKLRNAMLSLEDNIGTQIYSTNGDGDSGINGLRQTVKASGTCGLISSSDVATWASDIDASSATLTIALMEQAFLDASIGMDEPDIIVTTKTVFKKYYDLLQANQRFGPGETLSAGANFLLFNGRPVFHDSHCPGTPATGDNHMFFLNSRWLYFYMNKNMNMEIEKVASPASQAIMVQRILLGANLVTDNRRMHSAFTVLNH